MSEDDKYIKFPMASYEKCEVRWFSPLPEKEIHMTADFERDRELAEKLFVAKMAADAATFDNGFDSKKDMEEFVHSCFYWARVWRKYDAEMCVSHEAERKAKHDG